MSAIEGRERFQDALRARARDAVASARETVALSEIITSISMELGDGALTGRCAWCASYRMGDGRWVSIGRNTTIYPAVTAHTICDDCVAALHNDRDAPDTRS